MGQINSSIKSHDCSGNRASRMLLKTVNGGACWLRESELCIDAGLHASWSLFGMALIAHLIRASDRTLAQA